MGPALPNTFLFFLAECNYVRGGVRKVEIDKTTSLSAMWFQWSLCENTWVLRQDLSSRGWKLSRQMTLQWPNIISCYCSFKTISVCYHCCPPSVYNVCASVSITICEHAASPCPVQVCLFMSVVLVLNSLVGFPSHPQVRHLHPKKQALWNPR